MSESVKKCNQKCNIQAQILSKSIIKCRQKCDLQVQILTKSVPKCIQKFGKYALILSKSVPVWYTGIDITQTRAHYHATCNLKSSLDKFESYCVQSGHDYFIAVTVVNETYVSYPPVQGLTTTVSSNRDHTKRENWAELLESKIR